MSVDGLSLIGIDHHHSPVAVRERLAVGPTDMEDCLRFLTGECGAAGAVVLSTCNRTEFYFGGVADPWPVVDLICERQGVPITEVRDHLYDHQGRAALLHLFRVASSLESMVVGEYQIMHQVKFAYEQSRLHRCVSGELNKFFQRALAVGKEVRNETGIGKHKLSTASIAVDLAKAIHGELAGAHLLIAGAGDMAELALRHFLAQGVRRLTILNRNRRRAEELASNLAEHRDLELAIRHWHELPVALEEHDVVLSSTAAPVPIIRTDDVRRAMRKRRDPLMLIDLAVPRDVASEVADLDDVYLYNIDALEQVVARNRQLRDDEVDDAVTLVATRVDECTRELATDLGSLRKAVAGHFSELVDQEVAKLNGSLDQAASEEARAGMHRIAKKVQHEVMTWLREHGERDDAEELVRGLLGLNNKDG